MADASGGVCAAAETGAVFTEVSLLDSPAVLEDGRGGGATADNVPEGQQAGPRGSSEFKVRGGGGWHCIVVVSFFCSGCGSSSAGLDHRKAALCRPNASSHAVPYNPQYTLSLQFVPKPPPIMAPTRHNLLAPPTEANGSAGGTNGSAGGAAGAAPGGKLTKAEERAVGRVDRAVYLEYFRWAWCTEGLVC